MSNEQDERWYVQFDSQEVRLMTLDELDDAFQKGLVHEETYVIPVGASEWQTLGAILGGGDSDAEEAAAASEETSSEAVASEETWSDAAASEETSSAGPMSVAPTSDSVSAAPVTMPPLPVAGAAQLKPAASAWPPVASAASVLPTPQSVMPVVQDVSAGAGFDPDAAAFKPKKSKLALVGAVALTAIGGIGFAIARLDTPPGAESTAHAAALAPAPAATYAELSRPSTPTPEPTPAPAPTTTSASTSSSDSSSTESKDASAASKNKLSEDMKAALLAQDKERADKKKGGRATKPAKAVVSRRSSGKSGGSGPIKSGGNTHDPLNGAL